MKINSFSIKDIMYKQISKRDNNNSKRNNNSQGRNKSNREDINNR